MSNAIKILQNKNISSIFADTFTMKIFEQLLNLKRKKGQGHD